MNPPFGELSIETKSLLETSFPNSKTNLLTIFVDRSIHMVRDGGYIGAITSRTPFFLSSYRKWRKDVVLERSNVQIFADLGEGVLDDANVEVAAYCLKVK